MIELLLALAVVAPASHGGPHSCDTVRECRRVTAHRRYYRSRPWQHRYYHLPGYAKAKLRRVRWCESTNRPSAHGAGGLYHGYYQYDLRTWREAGGRGDPHWLTSREGRAEQHVRTWRFARRVGWGRWPVCGRR